jgi:hypothetical protein
MVRAHNYTRTAPDQPHPTSIQENNVPEED